MTKPVIKSKEAINEGLDENSVCSDCLGFGDSDGCFKCGKPSREYSETEMALNFYNDDYLVSKGNITDYWEDDEFEEEPIDWFFSEDQFDDNICFD